MFFRAYFFIFMVLMALLAGGCESPQNQDALKNSAQALREDGANYIFDPYDFDETYTAASAAEAFGGQGNKEAQDRLGFMYESGSYTDKNISSALIWYEKAANQGVVNSMVQIGKIRYYGVEAAQDFNQSQYWFEQANSSEAQRYLGMLYFDAKSRAKEHNYTKALELFNASNDTISQSFIARSYFYGLGVEQNITLAQEKIAAINTSGERYAQLAQGLFYESGYEQNGSILEQNLTNALLWYGYSAHEYDAIASFDDRVGLYAKARLLMPPLQDATLCQALVHPYDTDLESNSSYAQSLFERADTLNGEQSQFALGCIYELGLNGIVDSQKASAYYEKALAQGSADAQYRMGLAYRNGDFALTPDMARSNTLLCLSAKQLQPQAITFISDNNISCP